MNKKIVVIFLFVGIILLAAFLRLYLLGSVPAGLTNDEANTGYDSYSLLLTGKDQWNQPLPVVFRGFGDYPAPFYRYIAIPSIALFGLNAFAVRLPSALFGILSVGIIFFLVKKVFNQTSGFFAMTLLAVSPWAIGLSRVAIESNIAASFLLLGLFCYFNKTKNNTLLFLCSLFFALTLYTYSAYALLAPLLLLVLFLGGVLTKNLSFKNSVIALILFGIFISPLFLTKNTSAGNRFSQIGILHNITSVGLINTLNDQRGACLHYVPSHICKLENNKVIVFSTTLLKNYISHFSPDFLFLSGNETQSSILPQRGLEYLLSLIFFVAGAFSLTRRKYPQKFFLLLLLLAPLPDSLTSSGNYSRTFAMLPLLAIVEACGAYGLYQSITTVRQVFLRYVIFALIAFVCLVGTLSFFITYFTYFQDYYSRFSQYGYQQLMLYVKTEKNQYKNIYISSHLNDTKQYIYYLFYTKYNPLYYQKKDNITYHIAPDGWTWIDSIENVHFVASLSEIKAQKGDLLISHPTDFATCLGIFSVKDRIGYTLFEATTEEQFLPCISSLGK